MKPTNRKQRRDFLRSFKGKGGPVREVRKELFGWYGRALIDHQTAKNLEAMQ